MGKSKFKPTLDEAFSVGKLEGEKEVLQELQDLVKEGVSGESLNSYIKARLKTLNSRKFLNPFKKV